MFGTRFTTAAPTELGPTGPPSVTVLFIGGTTGGTHLNIDGDPQLASLKAAVAVDSPLMMAAEVANVYYSFASMGSGAPADPAAGVYGPTSINQCGIIFAGTRLPLPEQAPHGAKGLKISCGAGGTATLRIWSTG